MDYNGVPGDSRNRRRNNPCACTRPRRQGELTDCKRTTTCGSSHKNSGSMHSTSERSHHRLHIHKRFKVCIKSIVPQQNLRKQAYLFGDSVGYPN